MRGTLVGATFGRDRSVTWDSATVQPWPPTMTSVDLHHRERDCHLVEAMPSCSDDERTRPQPRAEAATPIGYG